MDDVLNSGILPGTIVAYGGTEDSLKNLEAKGWLLCDGKPYDAKSKQYMALAAAIGATWGGDNADKFHVPDLRGQFLRGVSGESTVDPNKNDRTPPRPDLNNTGAKGNNVGSLQKDSLKDHTHKHYVGSWQTNADSGDDRSYVGMDKNQVWDTLGTNDNVKSETRPTNVYVYYIIKL